LELKNRYQPIFKYYPSFTNRTAEDFFNTGLCLPSGTNMSREDLDRISKRMKEVLGRI
jgi:dTDP-4-amino-4,6-dideoxygalactose transaminase